MSRRARRRTASSACHAYGKLALGLLLACVLGSAGLVIAIHRYLHSDSFRTYLASRVNQGLAVHGAFSPFRWDGLAVDTPSYEGTGESLVRSIRLHDIHSEISLSGLRSGTWDIRGSRIRSLDLELDTTAHTAQTPEPRPAAEPRPARSKPKSAPPAWLPREFALQGLDIEQVYVRARSKNGEVALRGASIAVSPGSARDSYDIALAGGALALPLQRLPSIALQSVKLRASRDFVALISLDASALTDARVRATGDYDPATRAYTLQGDIDHFSCAELFNQTWARRISGTLSSDFAIRPADGKPAASGTLVLDRGVLTALPILDSLAAYADTSRFRTLAVSEGRTCWHWRDGVLTLSGFTLASEGLIRLEGSAVVRDRTIDGRFRLGLAPGTLSTIPGAETDVFLPGERGLLWTDIRITGDLDDPEEDLTKRLVAAAGVRMLEQIPETGEKVLKYSRRVVEKLPEKALDQSTKAIEKGVKILEDSRDVIEGASGILKGVLGD